MGERKVLMVEGKDDMHVINHLLKANSIPSIINVEVPIRTGDIEDSEILGGDRLLLQTFKARMKESDIIALGIVLDADTDLSARWQSVTDILRTQGYADISRTPDSAGTIIDPPERKPRIGIWIMPNNELTGNLESFVDLLIPEGDVLKSYVVQCIDDLPDIRFKSEDRPKAHIHTWLAWQEEPGTAMGAAINQRYLQHDGPLAQAFIEWVKRLAQ